MLDPIQDLVMTSQSADQPTQAKAPLLPFAAVYSLLTEQADSPEEKELEDWLPAAKEAGTKLAIELEEGEEKTKNSKCDKLPAEQMAAGLVGIFEGFGLLDQVEAKTAPATGLEAGASQASCPQARQLPVEQESADTAQAWMPLAGPGKENNCLSSAAAQAAPGASRAGPPDASSLENANNLTGTDQPPGRQPAFAQEKLARFFAQALARPARPADGPAEQKANLALGEPAAFILPDQAEAVAAQEQPELAAPVVQENLALLLDSLTARNTLTGQECVVTLKPEHLGRVRIELSLDKGAIRAQVQVESAAAGQLIRAESLQLDQMLQARGLSLASFEVSQNSLFMDSGPDRQPGRPWPETRKKARGKILDFQPEPPESYSSAGLPRLYSSVEFMA